LETELVIIRTSGDRFVDRSLSEIGGKGLFVKEIEEALLGETADLAVHSAKDLPGQLPKGLCISAFPMRADPRDALVSRDGLGFYELPEGARVGTSSARRREQLLVNRQDIFIEPLRGNVGTRLSKLVEGQYDALVLACAGLDRLSLSDKITERISPDLILPAAGQGSLAIETREDDPVSALVKKLNHEETALRVIAERAVLLTLGGDCNVPIGAYSEIDGSRLVLRGLLVNYDEGTIIRVTESGNKHDASAIGELVGQNLLSQGGREVMSALRAEK
jgi:hydroxymethylbilane synthase